MARGTQLSQLLEMFRVKIGSSTRTEVAPDSGESYKRLLSYWQQWLYDTYDWPFLEVRPVVNLAVSGQFYNIPEDINLESFRAVYAIDSNGNIYDTVRGIDVDQYRESNSAAGETSDPVRAWDIRWTGAKEQIEVWPLPATTPARLQIYAKRNLRRLVDVSDPCDLDDLLIVLHAAVEVLARNSDPAAETVMGEARSRLNLLKGKTDVGDSLMNFASGPRPDSGFFPPYDDTNWDSYMDFYSYSANFMRVPN